MFPRSFISFGVLHGIAVMLIVVRFTASWGAWRWPLGLVAIVLPKLVADPFFDTRWTNWVGLVTHLPVTEDYAPVLPWLGVVWWGAAATDWLLAQRPSLLAARCRAPPPLAVLGRWSLSFYMLHQPVLIGVLWLVATMRHDTPPPVRLSRVGVRLKTAPRSVVEVHVDAQPARPAMRQLVARAEGAEVRIVDSDDSACAASPATIATRASSRSSGGARSHSLDDTLEAAERAASRRSSSSSTASPIRTTSARACASPTGPARTP